MSDQTSEKTSRIEQLLAQAKSDTEEKTSISHAGHEFADAATAEKTFRRLREKLFRVERWNDESGASSFALFNEKGAPTPNKNAAVGDFIRIRLPGTGKYDWVKVIDVFEGSNETILTVQPTFDPTDDAPDKSVTSHFFTGESTNNFCLQHDDVKINMYVIGLNEITNTDEAENLFESARNLVTANVGHFLGFQKAEWTTFCNNFLENEGKSEN
ncbi:MAG TPA: hypothetical protein VF692_11540 [Pyrinomonadaceae bacterium]|jgi:hypothetical protein